MVVNDGDAWLRFVIKPSRGYSWYYMSSYRKYPFGQARRIARAAGLLRRTVLAHGGCRWRDTIPTLETRGDYNGQKRGTICPIDQLEDFRLREKIMRD